MNMVLNEIIKILKQRGYITSIYPNTEETQLLFYKEDDPTASVYALLVSDCGIQIGFISKSKFGYVLERCLRCSPARFSFRDFEEMFVRTKEKVNTLKWNNRLPVSSEGRTWVEFDHPNEVVVAYFSSQK